MRAPRAVFDAALRLRKLDDRDGVTDNSLLVGFSGGLSPAKQRELLADLRLLLRHTLGEDGPTFGDAA